MATINVGSWPIGIAVTPDGSKIYVANSALFENSTLNGSLSVINTTINIVTDTVPVGMNPHGVAITPDGSKVYVANAYDGTVSVINTTTDKVTTSIPVGLWPISIGQFIGGPVKTINSTIPTEIPPETVSTEALAETPSEAYCPEIKDYVPEYTGGAVIHIMNAVKNDIIVSWAKTNTSKAIFQVNIPAGQTQTVKAPGSSYDEYIRMECSWYKVTPGPVIVKSGYEYTWKYYTVLKDNTVVYDGTGFKPIPDSQAPKI
jgi:YVTN family beta-propeller protein